MDINKPRFELTSIYSDGSAEEPKIVPINELPLDTNTNRRGFLGAGLLAGAALTFLSKCKPNEAVKVPTVNLDSNSKENVQVNFPSDKLNAHCDIVTAVTISPDGKMLISAARDNSIKLWSLPQGRLLKSLKSKSDNIYSLVISKDEKRFAAISSSAVELWSLPEGSLIKATDGEFKNVITDENLRFLASRLKDRIELGDIVKGELLKTLAGNYNDFCMSRNGLYLAASSSTIEGSTKPGFIQVWSLPEGKPVKMFDNIISYIIKIAFSPDGNLLVAGMGPNYIALFPIPDGEPLPILEGNTQSEFLVVSSDQKIIVSGTHSHIELWSLPERKLLKIFEGVPYQGGALSVSADGRVLVSRSNERDSSISVWTLPEGNLKTIKGSSVTFQKYADAASLFSFSPDLKIMASALTGYAYGAISLWDIEKEEFIGFLFDKACNESKGMIYTVKDKVTGTMTTYTLPCGTTLPPQAVCTCNCVAGTKPVYTPPSSNKGNGVYCTCDQVCTCIPVCQAHKLLHPDKFVRSLSREILLFMGTREIEYMNWAATNSESRLRTAITSVIREIKSGIEPDYQNWPAIKVCQQYLQHDDEVVSVMAAQMINLLHNIRRLPVSQEICQRVESLLVKSEQMHWKKRLQH